MHTACMSTCTLLYNIQYTLHMMTAQCSVLTAQYTMYLIITERT